MKVKSEII